MFRNPDVVSCSFRVVFRDPDRGSSHATDRDSFRVLFRDPDRDRDPLHKPSREQRRGSLCKPPTVAS